MAASKSRERGAASLASRPPSGRKVRANNPLVIPSLTVAKDLATKSPVDGIE